MPQDQEVRDPLNIVGIVVQDQAPREHRAKLALQCALERTLITHVPPFVKL